MAKQKMKKKSAMEAVELLHTMPFQFWSGADRLEQAHRVQQPDDDDEGRVHEQADEGV